MKTTLFPLLALLATSAQAITTFVAPARPVFVAPRSTYVAPRTSTPAPPPPPAKPAAPVAPKEPTRSFNGYAVPPTPPIIIMPRVTTTSAQPAALPASACSNGWRSRWSFRCATG
jgi:hypothetical protein